MQQIRLAPIMLNEELTQQLLAKQHQYNDAHQGEPLDIQDTAKMMLEYAIRYLDITAFE